MSKKNITLNDIKKIAIYFLLIYIPTVLIILSFTNYFYDAALEKAKEPIISEQKQVSAVFSYNIHSIYEDIYSNIIFLKNSNEVQEYFSNLYRNNISEFEQFYVNFLNSHNLFVSISFFDQEGFEVSKIIKNREGNIQIIEQGLIEDKDEQYLYDFSSKDEISISLNPINSINRFNYPSVNFSIPIEYKNELQGYIILNYSGEIFLNNINQYYLDNELNINVSLLSSDDFWLERKGDSEGFVFISEENIEDSFSNTYSDIWESIFNNNEGLIENDEYIYYFQKVYPFQEISNQSFSWTVFTSFDKKQLLLFNEESFINIIRIRDYVLLSSFLIILIIVSLIYFRRKDIDNLNVLRIISDSKEEGVVITDTTTKIIYVNKAFEKITGYSVGEAIGLNTTILKSNKHDKEFYERMWKSIKENDYWAGEIWNKKKSGVLFIEYLTIYAVRSKSSKGKVEKYLSMFTDLTEQKEKEKYIDFLKNYDQFTNLPNERLFINLLEKSIDKKSDFFAVVYIKIANFEKIVMSYGTTISREITNQFISLIKNTIEKNDVLASITHEEFVLQLRGVSNKSEALQLLNELSLKVSQKIKVDNVEVVPKILCGISLYPDDDIEVVEILKNAKIALNFVPNNSSFSYKFFEQNLRESLIKEIELEHLLQNAINNSELEIYFQPQIDSLTKKIVGAEALMRWNNSKYGNIPPNVFIPIAEKSDQIITLSYWLIENVCKEINKLVELNLIDYRISINISPVHFSRLDFVDSFTNKFKENNCDISNIEIEITEGMFIENFDITNSTLQEFQSHGITVAIDDFGTGFSSLNYLRYLNIDKLKIDRSFIKDYPATDNGAIAGIITNLAKKLDLSIIAEGVDSYQQVEYLRNIGCSVIQGFYYSKPLNFKDFIEFVKDNKHNF